MCLALTSLEFVVKVSEDGEKEQRGRGGSVVVVVVGVRFRLVKSREAVILLSWREKVSTWSQRTSPSPRFPPLQSLR